MSKFGFTLTLFIPTYFPSSVLTTCFPPSFLFSFLAFLVCDGYGYGGLVATRFVMDGERIHNVLPPFHRDQLFSSALATNQVNPPPSAVTAPGPGLGLGLLAPGPGLGVGLGNLRIPPVVAGSGLGVAQGQGLAPAQGQELGVAQGLASGPGSGLGDNNNKIMLSASSQVVRQMDVINHGVTKPSSRWLGTLLFPHYPLRPYHYTHHRHDG